MNEDRLYLLITCGIAVVFFLWVWISAVRAADKEIEKEKEREKEREKKLENRVKELKKAEEEERQLKEKERKRKDDFKSMLEEYYSSKVDCYEESLKIWSLYIDRVSEEEFRKIIELFLNGPYGEYFKLFIMKENDFHIGHLVWTASFGKFEYYRANHTMVVLSTDEVFQYFSIDIEKMRDEIEQKKIQAIIRAKEIKEKRQSLIRKRVAVYEIVRSVKDYLIFEYRNRVNELREQSPEYYFGDLLTSLDFGCGYPYRQKVEVEIDDSGTMLIEFDLPAKKDLSRVKEGYFLKSGGYRERMFTEIEFNKKYENTLYDICLKSIWYVFVDDDRIDSIAFNGYVTDYDRTTGQLNRCLILSLLASRDKFMEVDLDHADPKMAFKGLKGVSGAKLYEITPVSPVLTFDKEGHKFIEGKHIDIGAGTNLASMDWKEFEQLVREIFETEFSKNGGEVKVTQSSRDGGVDVVIFDPDPIRGGKIYVQAKRYTNTVPVSAVRELHSIIISSGANSGILITTSDYGRDSYEYAKGKPIKLMNSGHLLGLLQKQGRSGYINIEEARKQSLEYN